MQRTHKVRRTCRCLIHKMRGIGILRTSRNRNSANFAFIEFCEVRGLRPRGLFARTPSRKLARGFGGGEIRPRAEFFLWYGYPSLYGLKPRTMGEVQHNTPPFSPPCWYQNTQPL